MQTDNEIIADWIKANADRNGSHLFEWKQNSGVFLTPYVAKYFRDDIPPLLSTHLSISRVAIISDVDLKIWKHEQSGSPFDAFNALTVAKSGKFDAYLDKFFEDTCMQHSKHLPAIHRYNYHTALIVLAAASTATRYLQEMAGSVMFETDSSIDPREMHLAMMRHEWAHLEEMPGLWPTEIEIFCDKAALAGMPEDLKLAWIDARVIGTLMWPFQSRAGGFALYDERYNSKTYIDEIINFQNTWSKTLTETFFDVERVGDVFSNIIHNDTTKKTVPAALVDVAYKWVTAKNEINNFNNLEGLFRQNNASDMFDVFTQSYAMHLQVSGAEDSIFHARILDLARKMLKSQAMQNSCTARFLDRFINAFEKRIPNLVPLTQENAHKSPAVMRVVLPTFQL